MTNKISPILTKSWYKIPILILSLITIFSLYSSTIDKKGEDIIENSLTEAIIVFGIAKGLNAAISLAQGTEVGPPGVNISIGEVLDPINDLVEQFSWIMLASITSLGIQKILMNFVTADIFNYFIVLFLIIFNIWLFIRFKNDSKARNIFFKFTIILVFLRLSIPLMSLANLHIYNNFVKPDYDIEKSTQIVESSSEKINNINYESNLPKKEEVESSWLSKLKEAKNTLSNIVDPTYYKAKVKEYQEATEETSKYILNLIIAFFFKTILFPLVFIFLLYLLIKRLADISRV